MLSKMYPDVPADPVESVRIPLTVMLFTITVPVNVGLAVIARVPPVPDCAVIAVPPLMAMDGVVIDDVCVKIKVVVVPGNVGEANGAAPVTWATV